MAEGKQDRVTIEKILQTDTPTFMKIVTRSFIRPRKSSKKSKYKLQLMKLDNLSHHVFF